MTHRLRHAVPRCWSRLTLSCLVAVAMPAGVFAADSVAPTSAVETRRFDDLLELLDGSSLHGHLDSIDRARGLRWFHPEATKPIDLRPSNLAWVRLRESPSALPQTPPSCHLRFANGDELYGRLLSLDRQSAELGAPFNPRLMVPRKNLSAITLLPDDFAVLYEGPTGLDGWVLSTNPNPWEYRGHSLVTRGTSLLARDVGLTGSLTLSFDLSWSDRFSLYVCAYTRVTNRFDFTASGYRFFLTSGSVALQRVEKGGRSVQLGREQVSSLLERPSAHVQILVERPEAALSVWLDGTLIKRWTDDQGFVSSGTGLVFFVPQAGPTLRLSNLRVIQGGPGWPTDPDLPTPLEQDVVYLANRDRATGSLTSIRDHRVSFSVSGADLEVPLTRVTRVVLRPPDTNSPPRVEGQIRAFLAGGGTVSFHLDKLDADRARGTSVNFGPLDFDARLIRILQFNLDRSQAAAATLENDDAWEGPE